MIFLGKLFIYVGYGIMKKKPKNYLRVLSIQRKIKVFVLVLIDWLKIDVYLFKTQINKKFFPRTPSEKYIPGKQCPKLQECAIRLG